MTAPAKSAKPAVKPETEIKSEVINAVPETVPDDVPANRIPEVLAANPILASICERYLSVLDEIAEYNKAVLAEKDSEWNSQKVLEKARNFARPTEKDVKPVLEVKKAVEVWEALQIQVSQARKAVLDATAKELGINLTNTAERDPAMEGPLKEKRKIAATIGSQLSMIAGLSIDEEANESVNAFLEQNPLPSIGRDQVHTFGNEGKATPKYRVVVKVIKDGQTILEEDGFTKASQGLTKPVFGYARGKSLKSEDLRKAWESAGNNSEKTVQPVVEFTDNDLQFVLTKK